MGVIRLRPRERFAATKAAAREGPEDVMSLPTLMQAKFRNVGPAANVCDSCQHTANSTSRGALGEIRLHDYSPGGCRQVKDAEITMNLGWAMPPLGSALIMRR